VFSNIVENALFCQDLGISVIHIVESPKPSKSHMIYH